MATPNRRGKRPRSSARPRRSRENNVRQARRALRFEALEPRRLLAYLSGTLYYELPADRYQGGKPQSIGISNAEVIVTGTITGSSTKVFEQQTYTNPEGQYDVGLLFLIFPSWVPAQHSTLTVAQQRLFEADDKRLCVRDRTAAVCRRVLAIHRLRTWREEPGHAV